MEQKDITTHAQRLTQARLTRNPIAQITRELPKEISFSRDEAYSIQEQGLKHRLEAGEKLIGYKMGLTSEAKRKQMNLDSPLYGVLTDKMQIAPEGTFPLALGIHPKIEPEIAFVFRESLKGTQTRERILEACDGVCAALEILDSRYDQFKYFSMEDVISDNSSSSHFVLGPWRRDFQTLDLTDLKLQMKINEEVATEGSTKAISDDPVVSVMQLLELLDQRGLGIEAGMIVLAGAATAAVALEEQMTIELEMQELEPVRVHS